MESKPSNKKNIVGGNVKKLILQARNKQRQKTGEAHETAPLGGLVSQKRGVGEGTHGLFGSSPIGGQEAQSELYLGKERGKNERGRSSYSITRDRTTSVKWGSYW